MRILLVYFLILLSYSSLSLSASATAKAKQVVVENLTVQKISDLDFGTASQNSPAKTVNAGTAEDNENASFKIHGDKNKTVQVVLPADNTVVLLLSTTPPLMKAPIRTFIAVNQFKSNILSAAIGSTGQLDLYVGATRDQIAANQATGYYEGSFVVNVVY